MRYFACTQALIRLNRIMRTEKCWPVPAAGIVTDWGMAISQKPPLD